MPEIYLKVDSAYPEDQGTGRVRLDPDTMLQLKVNPGDLVAIEGKRRTVGAVWRAMVNDWHQGKVRIDNFTRLNSDVNVGDLVKITTLDEEAEAKRVVLAPPEDLPKQLPINYSSVVDKLIDFPVVKNDSIPIQAGFPLMQPQLVAFKAVVVEPENAVIITKNTKIEFSEKSAESWSKGTSMPEVCMKVDSAYPEDQGAGKVRLDPDTMLQLTLNPGDLVAIEGRRRTVTKAWRALVNDWHQGTARIDNFTRLNSGVSIGDRVKIRTLDEEAEAKRVVLAPPEDLPKQLPINYGSVVNKLIDFPVVKNDSVPIQAGLPFMQPQLVAFKAVVVEPENAVIITKNTKIEFSEKPAAGFEGVKRISYEDIGGLKDKLQRIRETIELPMRHPEFFRWLGIEPPKGILLYGPPGTGKTLIAKTIASESGAHFISIAGPEVISKYTGESEQRIREVFEDARQHAPAIIFIDELDSIALRREKVTGEVELRVVAQLLTMMDGLEERGQVVVIGATSRLDVIDSAFLRPGRFDRKIEIGIPSEDDRMQILHVHTRDMPLAGDADMASIAQQTQGFVGADLAALAREAAIKALRRYLPEIDLRDDEIQPETLAKIQVQGRDFCDALHEMKLSVIQEDSLNVS